MNILARLWPHSFSTYFPALVVGAAAFWIGASIPVPQNSGAFNVTELAQVPVLANGRLKPFDSLARHSLLALRTRQTVPRTEGGELNATSWLLELIARPELAEQRAVFRIDHPEVLGLFGWQTSEKYFSFEALRPHLGEIQKQRVQIGDLEAGAQSTFQKAIVQLYNRLLLFQQLRTSFRPDDNADFSRELDAYVRSLAPGLEAARAQQAKEKFDEAALSELVSFAARYDSLSKATIVGLAWPLMSDTPRDEWANLGRSLLSTVKTGTVHPAVLGWAKVTSAYRAQNAAEFNAGVAELLSGARERFGAETSQAWLEYRFNHVEPFYLCLILYVFVFVLAVLSWMGWSAPLQRAALGLLLVTLALHTVGLLVRMYLHGRPPVTNLYASALFVGWVSVVTSVWLERTFRDGIGSVAAGVIGFATLLIAHNLSLDGDTMEMLRAVLDTNFWLATHVVTVTMGYGATFLAGALALIYVARGVFTPSLTPEVARALERMVYGVICFATLLSFVGTVLGGIWADQSWGRFWGWDPKENGALMIVLWNAAYLHLRWGKLCSERGLMAVAIFGNIITSFSWFGVNMLGVGLHSYGFMEEGFFWLALFVLSQLMAIGVALLPLELWRSAQPDVTGRPLSSTRL